MKQWAACSVGVALLSGCATVSDDDPRQGGLLGYWQHGESGYQERLERRQDEVDAVRREGETAQSETDRLEQRREAAHAELAEQRAALGQMTEQLAHVLQACAELETGDPTQALEKETVVGEVNALQKQITNLEQDTDLLIRERQRRISELKKELKLLRERASLLTTL